MTGHPLPPDPKPDHEADQSCNGDPEVPENVDPLCGTYEVGQIRISDFGGQPFQAKGVVPGPMKVTSIEFSYVPKHPSEECLEVLIEDFSTRNDPDSNAAVRLPKLSLLLQSDMSFWNMGDASHTFTVKDEFEMSVKASAGNSDLAPGILYVRFHCTEADKA